MKYILASILLTISLSTYAQPETEIYLFDMEVNGSMVKLSHPLNITHRVGYDNQPFFSPVQPIIYYTSTTDTSGHTDIKSYNYKTSITKLFTNTPENEYSPTVTPDHKFLSCIIGRNVGKKDGTQFLGKYPINGGIPTILIKDRLVGYHAWMDNDRLILFILDDTSHNSLHFFNLITKDDKLICNKPGRSLQNIPGENSISFIDKTDSNNIRVKKINTTNIEVSDVTRVLPNAEYAAWVSKNLLLMSDGKNIFSNNLDGKIGWQHVLISGPSVFMKGVSRMAISPDRTKLAVVVSE